MRVGSSVVGGLLWMGAGVSVALSDCQRCEQTGDCSAAYRGTPGQFCGHWLDQANQRQSCCCPVDATCRVSNSACNCAVRHDRRAVVYASDPLLWLWWLLGALALVACCAGCVYTLCVRTNRTAYGTTDDDVPVAYPVNRPADTPQTVYGAAQPAAGNYGTAPPLYATPGYAAPVYGGGPGGYGGYGGGGGMGAGSGAALGGAAGLLGGVLLGEAIADAGDRGGAVYDGGYAGGDSGGGGFDAGVGDFGGDF